MAGCSSALQLGLPFSHSPPPLYLRLQSPPVSSVLSSLSTPVSCGPNRLKPVSSNRKASLSLDSSL